MPRLELEYCDFYLHIEIAIQKSLTSLFSFHLFAPPRKSIGRNHKKFKITLLQYLSIKHFVMDSVNQSSSQIYHGIWKSYPKANFISKYEHLPSKNYTVITSKNLTITTDITSFLSIFTFSQFLQSFFLFKMFYLRLRWVFVAACRLSLLAVSRGYSSLWCSGFSLRQLL